MRCPVSLLLQHGSFVSSGQRYLIEPAEERNTKIHAHLRKFHIVFRHSALEDDVSNAPSTCGLVGKFHLDYTRSVCAYNTVKKKSTQPTIMHVFRYTGNLSCFKVPLFYIYLDMSYDKKCILRHIMSCAKSDRTL